MNAEILKLRVLPTPRWTFAICLLCLAIALTIGAFVGIGNPDDDVILGLGAELPTAVAAIVLGAWMVGVEYGQGTMRRTLTADPRRLRVIGRKLAAALVAVTVLTVGLFVVGLVFLPLIASAHDVSVSVSDILTSLVATLIGNLYAAAFGAAVVLLTRSMAAGVTIALLFGFVVDTALAAIPSVGDYTMQGSMVQIDSAIRSTPDTTVHLLQAIPTAAAWFAVILGLALLRFTRSDV
jgi:ABC-type transport system involved in multi-copper enzyme maturation permease subunit